jgi:hypothetical protein
MPESIPPPHGEPLQFDAAVPRAGAHAAAACAQCKRPIVSTYWETGGLVLCESCKMALDDLHGENAGAGAAPTARALLFGVGAAVAGAAIYLIILLFSGYQIGLVAILVGWMVGWSVRKGTRDRGGRRFQVMAVILTYFAISVSYVPQMIMSNAAAARANDDGSSAVKITARAGGSDSVTQPVPPPTFTAAESAALRRVQPNWVYVAGGIAILLVVAPIKVIVTNFPGSIISALIIGFGLLQAWRLPQRVVLTFRGPFQLKAAAPPAPTA